LICSVVSIAYLVIQQKKLPHQKDVVCKTAAKSMEAVQVLLLPTLERKLSCCLQDAQHPSRPAKPLLRNALGPELRCCLQDFVDAAGGPGTFGVLGYGPLRRGVRCGTAANNPGYKTATSGGYRGKHCGIRDRRRSSAGGSRCVADVGKQLHRKPFAAAETWKVERTSDSSDSAVPA
jgi:hypothetical protein